MYGTMTLSKPINPFNSVNEFFDLILTDSVMHQLSCISIFNLRAVF